MLTTEGTEAGTEGTEEILADTGIRCELDNFGVPTTKKTAGGAESAEGISRTLLCDLCDLLRYFRVPTIRH